MGLQPFVRQYQSFGRVAKLKFGIGNDDAARFGIIRRSLVNLDTEIAQLLAQLLARQAYHALERNVLVVAAGCFDGRSEDRLRAVVRLAQSPGRLAAADR